MKRATLVTSVALQDGAEIGALFTVALRKEQAGWLITGWVWSRP
jgi:hypothetical protein